MKKRVKEHLDHFTIAGFTYYDGAEAFEQLKIGSLVTLELEEDNAYDPRAVKIMFGEYHLGYIPRNSNRIFYKLLKVGINNIQCRIQKISPMEDPEKQIQVVAHLVESTKTKK